MISVSVKERKGGWQKTKFQGAKLSKSGGNIILVFKIESGEQATFLLKNPPLRNEINHFLDCMDLPQLSQNEPINIPEVGEALGIYNREVAGLITYNGDYCNLKKINSLKSHPELGIEEPTEKNNDETPF